MESPSFCKRVGTQPNAVIKCLTNPEELLPNDLKALNVWKNEKYSKKVSQLTAQFTINGKEMELPCTSARTIYWF